MEKIRPADGAPEKIYGHIDGAVVMIGFGSVGRGLLFLMERHVGFSPENMVVIDPDDTHRHILDARGIRFIQARLTPENYLGILKPLLPAAGGRNFCINVAIDVCSLSVMRLCAETDTLYIDSSIEPWAGFFEDGAHDIAAHTVYALREKFLEERKRRGGGVTAVTSCGANPGAVSWLVKRALLNLAADLGLGAGVPASKLEWARLMQRAGVKGMHIAERDTQISAHPRPHGSFVNTWSVEGMIAESRQAAEVGWGTHEKWMPSTARQHKSGTKAAIYMLQSGGNTRLRSWCPTFGAQYSLLVPHSEAITISDYFTVGSGEKPEYRPTCHYAYRPSDAALLSLDEMFGMGGTPPPDQSVMTAEEIVEGMDELGVLLYGHAKNAYWYGTRLMIEDVRRLTPAQNATGLQVSSALLAGIVWALENPAAGMVEPEEMDFERCLELQRPYFGTIQGVYTDWTPLDSRSTVFPEDMDEEDPWQFRNVLVRRRAF